VLQSPLLTRNRGRYNRQKMSSPLR